jgi:hypothetical protein
LLSSLFRDVACFWLRERLGATERFMQ